MENIQDKIQEIHAKYGTSELANYKIEQFFECLLVEFSEFIKSNTAHINYGSEELTKDFLTKLNERKSE
jgi:hypothetical protein